MKVGAIVEVSYRSVICAGKSVGRWCECGEESLEETQMVSYNFMIKNRSTKLI